MKAKKTLASAHKKIAQLLGDPVEYAQSIVDTVREPLIILDGDLKIRSASRSFYQMFKVKPKETEGEFIYDLGNRQWNIPKLRKLLEKILPNSASFDNFEVEHEFPEIGKRTMLLNARRIPRPPAKPQIMLLAIEDITERSRLQKELKDSEERYRRAFETSRDGLLLVHKTKASIVNSNESVQELLGYSSSEFLKKKLWEVGVTKGDKDFLTTVSRLEKNGVIHYEDIPVKTKKGPSINSEIFLVNKAKVIQCNIRDITARKKAEEALRLAEELFRTTIHDLPIAVFALDSEGKFMLSEGQGLEILDIFPEKVMGKSAYEVFSDRPALVENIRQALKGKEGKITIDIDKFTILFRCSPASDGDGAKGAIGVIIDITQRKKMEDELQEKVENLEKFKKLTVDRELKMKELKAKIKELEAKLK